MNPHATPVFTRHEVYVNPPYEEHVEHVEMPVYDAEYERANFRYREEEYNQYISKLNTAYAVKTPYMNIEKLISKDLNVKYQDAIRVNQILKDENENLKRSSGEDVRNIYSLYTESKSKLSEYEFDNKTLAKELQARDEELIVKNTELNHLRNLVNDLKGQLGQMDINQTVDSQELTKIIGEQKNELGDMRRRLNLSLDHRRKLEQEVEALKFNNENTTSKFENELREKDMRMNQALRSVENEVHNRTKELTVQLTTYNKLEHDNIVLDRKNKELINDIALHINAEKLLHQEIEHKDRQNEAMRRELEIYKDPKRKATLLSFRPTANTHLIKLCNARFAREKQDLFFKIWRLRYLLANEMKFRLTNEPLHGVDVADEDLRNKKRIVFDFDDTNDIGIATTLADGLLRTLKYVRQRASAIIFEIFVRSANNAEQKKSNSLILFSINVKEIDDRAWKTLSLLLDTYVIIRRLMKAFHPKFVKMKKPAGAGVLEKKLTYSLGKLTLQKGDIRDRTQVNRWIENSLVYIVNKRKYEQDLNKEFLFLYRVLAIKYRVLYPMRGKELDIEEDLRVYIDHKVLSSLHKVLKTHPKENQPLFDSKLIEDLDIRQMAGYGEEEEIEM